MLETYLFRQIYFAVDNFLSLIYRLMPLICGLVLVIYRLVAIIRLSISKLRGL